MRKTDMTLKVIREASDIESFGYNFYNTLRDRVSDPTGQIVLAFLAGLEVDHMLWLEREYMRQLKSLSALNEGHIDRMDMAAKEKIFVVDKLPELYKGTDMTEALEFAVQVEERSVIFYRNAMKLVEDQELRNLFERLADFEMDHVKLLKLNISSLKKKGLWTPPKEA